MALASSLDCQQKIIELAKANGIGIQFMSGGYSQQIFLEGDYNAEFHIHITIMNDGSSLGYEPTTLSKKINNPYRLPHITVPTGHVRMSYYYHTESGNIVVSNTDEIYNNLPRSNLLPSNSKFELLDNLLREIISNRILETCEFKKIQWMTEKNSPSDFELLIARPTYKEKIEPIVKSLIKYKAQLKSSPDNNRLKKLLEENINKLESELKEITKPSRLKSAINAILAINKFNPAFAGSAGSGAGSAVAGSSGPLNPYDNVLAFILDGDISESDVEDLLTTPVPKNLTGGYKYNYPIFKLFSGYKPSYFSYPIFIVSHVY